MQEAKGSKKVIQKVVSGMEEFLYIYILNIIMT